jgi:DNA-3-methyladenine glycosylase I
MLELNTDIKPRCAWPGKDASMMYYHDTEWGVPLYDDSRLFEFIILDGFQAGLSWTTILHKRENFRKVFDHFNAAKIARYNEAKVQALLLDPRIIRNKLKIQATINNARAYLDILEREGSFSSYLWGFVNGKPIQNNWTDLKQVPAFSKESDAMSKALKKAGFSFVGTTICYAFMQAAGLVNDHITSCHRHDPIKKMSVG